MRHSKKRHKLGRSAPHRKATLAALGSALIAHKRITTTVAKAKALRTYIEPIITRAKEDSQHNRRQVFRRLQDKQAVSTLFTDISEQVGDRPGGYTRVIKLGRRSGDGANLAMIELVDYNDVRPEGTRTGGTRTRRGGGKGRRRSKAKGAASTAAQPTQSETQTTRQVETPDKGAATEAVEKDVSDEKAKPVTERTEAGGVPEDVVEAAEDATKAQSEAAEPETEAAEPEAKAADEDREAVRPESAAAEAADPVAKTDDAEGGESETSEEDVPKAEAESADSAADEDGGPSEDDDRPSEDEDKPA
jgi:large subunit ribosomal protein L17